jgi:hypothetical protein
MRPCIQSLNIIILISKMNRHPLYLRQTIPPIRTCLYTRRRKMQRIAIEHLVLDDWRFISQHHAPTGTLPHTLRRRDFWRGNGASVMDLLSWVLLDAASGGVVRFEIYIVLVEVAEVWETRVC